MGASGEVPTGEGSTQSPLPPPPPGGRRDVVPAASRSKVESGQAGSLPWPHCVLLPPWSCSSRKSIRPCSSTNIHAIRFHCRTRHERLFLRLIDAVILREEHVQTDLEDGEEKFCDQDEISEDKN
ncbi:unnamed protein product [Lepidochelys kempii]